MSFRAAAIALLLVFLAGCGGQDEAPSDRGRDPGEGGAATSEAPDGAEGTALLADCLSRAGFQEVTRGGGGLIRASDPETGGVVRLRSFASGAEAEKLARAEDSETAIAADTVAIYPDHLAEAAKTAAERCMRSTGDPPE